MSGRLPEHAVRPAVGLQTWADLTFLHWRMPPADLQRLLPPGLRIDVLDGSAWLGLTPFRMQDVRAPGVPAVPGWSTFGECNVRTYVTGPDGRDGIWFFRLVCRRRAVVAALRAFGLPYVRADAVTARRDEEVRYRYQRVGDGAVTQLRCDVTLGAALGEAERTPLVDSLTGRWNAWSTVGGRLLRVPVEHGVWPLQHASVRFRSLPRDLAGVERPDGPPTLVHFSAGVRTRIGLPRPV